METDLETEVDADGCWIQSPSCIGGRTPGGGLEEEVAAGLFVLLVV